MKKYVLVLLIIAASCNTSTKQKPDWPIDFDELVELHCLSVEYKNARFALADSIRFLQDSIIASESMNGEDSLLIAHLDQLEIRKEVLSEKSYALSDTIEARMNVIIRELSPEEKRVFNDSLISQTKACL
jgi:hypothetical protein